MGTRQFAKVPALVEGFGSIMQTIKYHRDKSEGLSSQMAISQSLSQQSIPRPLALRLPIHAEPGENSDWQCTSWQPFRSFMGQVTKVDLPGCQSVETSNSLTIQQNFRGRQVLVLILQGSRLKPLVDRRLSAIEIFSAMASLENSQSKSFRKLDATQRSPRISLPSFFCAGVSFTGACSARQKDSCSSGLS